jgi:hypothetical protein
MPDGKVYQVGNVAKDMGGTVRQLQSRNGHDSVAEAERLVGRHALREAKAKGERNAKVLKQIGELESQAADEMAKANALEAPADPLKAYYRGKASEFRDQAAELRKELDK